MNRKDEFLTRMTSALLVAEYPDVHDEAQRSQALQDLAGVARELRHRLSIARAAADYSLPSDEIAEIAATA